MNRFSLNKGVFFRLGVVLSLMALLTACEQQNYEPNLSVAPGGGTVSTYKSYSLASAAGATVDGRVVFYRYSPTVTLVQMGLSNTTNGTSYSASIYQGAVATNSATALKALGAVSGETGAFSADKYYVINEAGFYDNLNTYNASVKVMAGSTVVATGNIGANATPVAQAQ